MGRSCCPWCARTNQTMEGRCWHCNAPWCAPVTLSTFAPVLRHAQARRARFIAGETVSVAMQVVDFGDSAFDLGDVVRLGDDVRIIIDPVLHRRRSPIGLPETWVRDYGSHVAPSLTDEEELYHFSLMREVQAAESLDEAAVEVERLLLLVVTALDAGDVLTSIDVYDAGWDIWGGCPDCGAWPGERHVDDDCGVDILGDRPVYWGEWEVACRRRPGLLTALELVVGEVARTVEDVPPPLRSRRLLAAQKRLAFVLDWSKTVREEPAWAALALEQPALGAFAGGPA